MKDSRLISFTCCFISLINGKWWYIIYYHLRFVIDIWMEVRGKANFELWNSQNVCYCLGYMYLYLAQPKKTCCFYHVLSPSFTIDDLYCFRGHCVRWFSKDKCACIRKKLWPLEFVVQIAIWICNTSIGADGCLVCSSSLETDGCLVCSTSMGADCCLVL